MEKNIMQEFKILETGSKFISENANQFGEKYQKKFIAVHGEKLVAVDEDFDKVVIKIEEEKINPRFVLIEYIPDKGEIVLY